MILEALSGARKRPLTRGQLIEYVYQLGDEPENPDNGIYVTLHHLRTDLAPVGLTVRSDGPGKGPGGYWLGLLPEAAE